MVEGAEMKNSKFQVPSSKFQAPGSRKDQGLAGKGTEAFEVSEQRPFSPTAPGLEFAGWNFLGTWNLELGTSSP
jgi:hypothetical protein